MSGGVAGPAPRWRRTGRAPTPTGIFRFRTSGAADVRDSEPLYTAAMADLHACSFESRRGPEMAALLSRAGADATVAASMREVGLESNAAALALAQRLVAGDLRGSLLILLTGVGARTLFEAAATAVPQDDLVAALNELTVLVRGPKPVPV